jgi:hypothetical protein
MCYSLSLYLYLYLYHALLREAMQPLAVPDQQEDENNVQVQALAQKQVQVEVQVQQQQRAVFSSIDQVKQHTAVPNGQVNYCT